MLKTIDSDARKLDIPKDTSWIETYSLSDWNTREVDDIEESIKRNHVFVIRDTNLNVGWNFDMRSAAKVKGGPEPVEVQGAQY